MPYSIREAIKIHGKQSEKRWLIVEDGTPNVAMHTKKSLAETTLKALQDGKARFCECGNFVIGIKGNTAGHFCSAINRFKSNK